MDLIEYSKQRAIECMEIFLRNFSKVPDDKLHWSPTSTSKSAMRIAAHTALYAGRFAKMIRERCLPSPAHLDEWIEKQNAEELYIVNREEIEPIFRTGTNEVLAALDGLSIDDVHSVLDSGQGWSVPMTRLMELPGWHATVHTGQIDFLQTCWDDQNVYVE